MLLQEEILEKQKTVIKNKQKYKMDIINAVKAKEVSIWDCEQINEVLTRRTKHTTWEGNWCIDNRTKWVV